VFVSDAMQARVPVRERKASQLMDLFIGRAHPAVAGEPPIGDGNCLTPWSGGVRPSESGSGANWLLEFVFAIETVGSIVPE